MGKVAGAIVISCTKAVSSDSFRFGSTATTQCAFRTTALTTNFSKRQGGRKLPRRNLCPTRAKGVSAVHLTIETFCHRRRKHARCNSRQCRDRFVTTTASGLGRVLCRLQSLTLLRQRALRELDSICILFGDELFHLQALLRRAKLRLHHELTPGSIGLELLQKTVKALQRCKRRR